MKRLVLERGEQLLVRLERLGDAVALGANGGDLLGVCLLFRRLEEWGCGQIGHH